MASNYKIEGMFDDIFNQPLSQQQPPSQLYGVLSDIANQGAQEYQGMVVPSAGEVRESIQLQEPGFDETATVTEESSTEPTFLSRLGNALTDEGVWASLAALGALQDGDMQRYENAQSRYSNIMQQRRAKIAQEQQATLAAQKEARDWQYKAEKDAYDRNLALAKFTPESVAEFQSTGDASVLMEKPKLEAPLSEYQRQSLALREREINSKEDDATAKRLESSKYASNGTDSGLPDGITKSEDGVFYKPKYYKGQIVGREPVGPEQQKSLQALESSKKESAGQYQMNKDLQTLRDAADAENVGSFTGQLVGRSGVLQDLGSTIGGDDNARTAFRAAERIDGMMLSQGVADAKAMGASGINTAAEAQMYFKGMPRLDYTSSKALTRSIDDINEYTRRFNESKGLEKTNSTGQAPAKGSSQAAPASKSTGKHSDLW